MSGPFDDADDDPSLPFEEAIEWVFGTCGLGELTDDLPENYDTAKVQTEYLQDVLNAVDTFGWDTVTLAIADDYPIVFQNEQADDKPTMVIAPIVTESGGEE